MNYQENLEQVREQIELSAKNAGRNCKDITLLAVSKTHPASSVRDVARLGHFDFGENYIQEALQKKAELADIKGLLWHFIGHLQSNKARQAAGAFELIHTLHSSSLARALHSALHNRHNVLEEQARGSESAALASFLTQKVLIQVNIGREDQKSGVMPEALPFLVEEVMGLEHLSLEGLMCIPPLTSNKEDARPYFAQMRNLAEEMGEKFGRENFSTLSMGMSQDFDVAIAEGATIVRVGTVIFGYREYNVN